MNTRLKFPIRLLSVLIFVASLIGSAVAVTPAYAATITVSNSNDSGTGSLRQAILDANAGDTINFNGDYSITLTSGPLTISKNLTIDGSGHNVTVSGSDTMFNVTGGNVAFDHLTFANGNASTGSGGAMLIQSASTVTVTDSAFSGNQANFNGGAIASNGTLTVTNSTFSGNSAADGGAIASSGTLTVTGSTFTGGFQTGAGAGIWNFGTAAISNSAFSNNSAQEGGAIYNGNGATLGMTGSTFSNNSSSSGYPGGAIANDGTATIQGGTFSNNSAASDGGGIDNTGTVAVMNTTFSSNSASSGNGGGIDNNGTLTVTDSTLSNNTATTGGAIAGDSSISIITVTGSTFSGNSALTDGGGIENLGTLAVTNSSLSGNSAAEGGGIMQEGATSPALTLTNSTFSNNSGNGTLGMLAGTVTVNNTIVANGSIEDCLSGQSLTLSGSHNLADDASCPAANFTQKTSSQISLGTLGSHGGPTQVIPLLAGSAAIDAGDDTICAAAPVNNLDQRGATRPSGSHCDIGALEYGAGITFTVTNGNDSGAGSLRDAITQALPGDTVNFSGDTTVTLTSGELAISQDLTITGAGHKVTVSGNNATRVFDVIGGNVAFDHLTIENGNAGGGNGGGIDNNGSLAVINSTLSNNTATTGGAIAAHSSISTIAVTGSTFSGNAALTDGGGIENLGRLDVANSTFSGNSAAEGGGIMQEGATSPVLTLTNSTFSNNSGTGGALGMLAGTVTVNNTVVANSAGGNCISGQTATFSGSHNLADGANCPEIFSQSSSVNLGPLGNNGGPTQTMALLAGSAAIDAGDNTACQTAPINNLDQRGFTRITASDPTCDIGAFEVQGTAPAITSANSATFTVGSAGSFSVTTTGIPTAAITESGALPGGVTFTDNGNGTATLFGTPGLGSGGIYPLTIKASNGVSPDATQSFTLTVRYNFTGFVAPVLNPPSLNLVNSGSSVPLKFNLAGNQGLNILAANSPASQQINCTAPFAPIGSIARTSPSGMSGLTYNALTNTYIYSWKTASGWKGTCRQFILTLKDGTVHLAFFKFK